MAGGRVSRTPGPLDNFYATSLGCSPEELAANSLTVVASDPSSIRFAKGAPLALYALAGAGAGGGTGGAVIAVRSGLVEVVRQAVRGSDVLDDATCDAIERAVSPHVSVRCWFRGVRLYCEPDAFVDRASGEVGEVMPEEDERALLLHNMWGGRVFGQMVGGKVVSWAAVKPLSDTVWDLSIETLPNYQGHGYASSAVSAALTHIFANGRLAGWGCDRTSAASLRVARSVGFRHYAFDFGCVEMLTR
jgi:GNAT superfamily N-acetyltransferase